MKKIVIANWKMNGNIYNIKLLIEQLILFYKKEVGLMKFIVVPPFIYIPLVVSILKKELDVLDIFCGAQNIYPEENGPFTGEISVSMLKDYDCRYVLVGHFERRSIFKENNALISKKFHFIRSKEMIPILCIGESDIEKKNKKTELVLENQLLSIFTKNSELINYSNKEFFKNCIIAYEPIWAINNRKVILDMVYLQDTISFIKNVIFKINKGIDGNVHIVYGGGINKNNIELLFSKLSISGVLIGRSSLNLCSFLDIVKCINLY
ncbi:triose-phosphate isomerase [Candidatus Legionella polyplacis]|uniref:triose-phosphate isomerase n=1 Tax=Candidatus Legionella polyplacis TaxID=2005262 RepID=UPI000C1E61FC|nr:triose-phosphate isomerase [Candidatus Legionella polyplacis]ATW01810.1 triose-phosphate isomerase [Candidatus Legionella polyplacis]